MDSLLIYTIHSRISHASKTQVHTHLTAEPEARGGGAAESRVLRTVAVNILAL